MAPEAYKEHIKAKDRARNHKGGGGGAKKGGAVKGATPLLESRDEHITHPPTPSFSRVNGYYTDG